MSTLWFVVPAHGRLELSAICLRQLRRTCDALTEAGIEATAVVIACDENLDTARELGFGTIERDNTFLSRRFNDGIQLACDPAFNPRPAAYVVPCGSDDWVDWRILTELPPADEIVAFQHVSFVREDGRELTSSFIGYTGGCGIRIYPRRAMWKLGYRPADEDRKRGCDTSILTNLRHHASRLTVRHRPIDHRQIVDWKSPVEQVTSYASVLRWGRGAPARSLPRARGLLSRGGARGDALPLRPRARMRLKNEPQVEFGLYRVVGDRLYRGHDPGTEFEARLDRNAEARACARGDIEFLRRVSPALEPGSFVFPEGWLAQPHPSTRGAERRLSHSRRQ